MLSFPKKEEELNLYSVFVEQVIYFDYELFANGSDLMFSNDMVRYILMPVLSLMYLLINYVSCSPESSRVLEYCSHYS